MIKECLFRDTVVSEFCNKPHCGLNYTEITNEYYEEYCCTQKFRKCARFKEFYDKILNDNDD